MTEAKHTPGPWTAHYGWASDNRTSPDPEHPDWCEVIGGNFNDGTRFSATGHMGIANARLIAAAIAKAKGE